MVRDAGTAAYTACARRASGRKPQCMHTWAELLARGISTRVALPRTCAAERIGLHARP